MNARKLARLKELLTACIYSQKLLWKYARSLFVINTISGVIDGLTPVAQAYLAGAILGELSEIPAGTASRNHLILLVVASALLTAVSYVVSTARSYYFYGKREQMEAKLRGELLEKKSLLALEEFELPKVRDSFERAYTGLSEVVWVTRTLTDLGSAVISIIGVLAVVASTIPLLIIVLLPMPLLSGWARLRNYSVSRSMWDSARAQRMRANSIEGLFDNATSIMELRLFGLTKKLVAMWHRETRAVYTTRIKDEKKSAVLGIFTELVETLVGVAVDIWLVFRVFAGTIAIGLFEQTRRLVSSYILSLSRITSASADLLIDGYKLNDYRLFMQKPFMQRPDTGKPLTGPPKIIKLDNVTFQYPTGTEPVLQHIKLSITAGEHVAIVGENGAGKTTLLKVLLGLYHPTQGELLIDGKSSADLDISSLHQYIAPLMQDFSPMDFLNIRDSVAISDLGAVDEGRVRQVLETVNLWEFVTSLPKQLETELGYVEDDGIKLSGGQWQRLAIARALYKQAPILVLDEPTSAIDAKSEQEIVDAVFEAYAAKTVLIVSHRVSTVRRAKRILVVKGGVIVEEGTHASLFREGSAYYDLFHKQVKAISD